MHRLRNHSQWHVWRAASLAQRMLREMPWTIGGAALDSPARPSQALPFVCRTLSALCRPPAGGRCRQGRAHRTAGSVAAAQRTRRLGGVTACRRGVRTGAAFVLAVAGSTSGPRLCRGTGARRGRRRRALPNRTNHRALPWAGQRWATRCSGRAGIASIGATNPVHRPTSGVRTRSTGCAVSAGPGRRAGAARRRRVDLARRRVRLPPGALTDAPS